MSEARMPVLISLLRNILEEEKNLQELSQKYEKILEKEEYGLWKFDSVVEGPRCNFKCNLTKNQFEEMLNYYSKLENYDETTIDSTTIIKNEMYNIVGQVSENKMRYTIGISIPLNDFEIMKQFLYLPVK